MNWNKNKLVKGMVTASLMGAIWGPANAMTWEVGDSSVDLYGYVKLDMIYDLDADLGNAVTRSNIRLDGEKGSEGHLNLHAYQTRFGVKTSTPTDQGPFNTLIELDFWGGDKLAAYGLQTSSQIVRLRRAYAEWNGILAGQNVSNFGPETAGMPTLDFYNQPGGPAGRVPQIRYTYGGFSVSIEDPEIAGGSIPVVDKGDDPKSDIPTITTTYRASTGGLKYVASAMARKLEYYDASRDSEESAYGWGVMTQAAYTMGGTTIRGGVTHGDGIGSQIYFNFGKPGFYDVTTGELETVIATGIKASLSQVIGTGSVNVGASRVINDVDDAVKMGAMDASTDEKQTSYYLNYIWSPLKRITYGVEVSHHTRETFDGQEGSATRLQGSLKYSF